MSEPAELYTIGQAAQRVGVPARTIRFWCDAGILAPTDRSAGGYRRYDATAVARLDVVRTLRDDPSLRFELLSSVSGVDDMMIGYS